MNHLESFNHKSDKLYTIGSEEQYDEGVKRNNIFKGKGGSVWRNLENAQKYLKSASVELNGKIVPGAIYMMYGNWDKDVKKVNDDYGHLRNPLKIIEKVVASSQK